MGSVISLFDVLVCSGIVDVGSHVRLCLELVQA